MYPYGSKRDYSIKKGVRRMRPDRLNQVGRFHRAPMRVSPRKQTGKYTATAKVPTQIAHRTFSGVIPPVPLLSESNQKISAQATTSTAILQPQKSTPAQNLAKVRNATSFSCIFTFPFRLKKEQQPRYSIATMRSRSSVRLLKVDFSRCAKRVTGLPPESVPPKSATVA